MGQRRSLKIREFNPLGRVPTWVLPEGESLVESAMILDYLDETAGAGRALLPRTGLQRRQALRIMAIAGGAAEKGVLQLYEKAFRPEEKRYEGWPPADAPPSPYPSLEALSARCVALPVFRAVRADSVPPG